MRLCFLVLVLISLSSLFLVSSSQNDLLVLTVATHNNDALVRFKRSAQLFGYPLKTLGLGLEWKGGNVESSTGGGQKVNLLRKELESLPRDQLVLFTDSYDALFLDSSDELLKRYHSLGANVLFSAEIFCWPDKDLQDKYPAVGEYEKRFLNSGGFIGPAGDLLDIVSHKSITDEEDDQLFYTQVFLDEGMRKRFGIKLDTLSEIFQTLNGAMSEVLVKYRGKTGYLYNVKTKSNPTLVHGNGPIKSGFNSLANYLAYSWTPKDGCIHCNEGILNLQALEVNEYPILFVATFVEVPTPFLDVFFERVARLTYPKSRIHLLIHLNDNARTQRHIMEGFNATHGLRYKSTTELIFDSELEARATALSACSASVECEFIFLLDSTAQLTKVDTLEHLVSKNRNFLAPLLRRRGKLWSNFWGALSKDGYYARSDDYVDLVESARVGLWNVPFVTDAYLLSKWAAMNLRDALSDFNSTSDSNMLLAEAARKNYVFMFMDNSEEFGHLTFPDSYSTNHLNNDLWQLFDNPLDWEEQYIHTNYSKLIAPEFQLSDFEQPCPDVFWFPFVSEKFCKQIIEEMEHFGQWSNGQNQDPRLEGGYENVPTRDIHMRQVEWEEHWLHILRKYIHPIQKKVFQGYDDTPWARMSFIVRYRPDEQASLRPHHDSSSFTINLSLNSVGLDYQGGGAKFLRYDCSIINTRMGYALMHPGRVTHIHEGLLTTNGTRYIFVTFVNP